jgi:hypothetical protein
MKQPFTLTAKLANFLTAIVLALTPLHAFLTVWASSAVGHYTILRLWDDGILLILIGIAVYWLVKDSTTRTWFFDSLLVRLIIAYASLTVVLGIVSYIKGDVTLRALAYGLLVNLRFIAWFLVVLLTAQRTPTLQRQWKTLVLIPAAVVIVFAALQYTLLPHDFLAHFGYNTATTIAPVETINHNSQYIRVQSTLRGANPLGAYLVVVLSILGGLAMSGWRRILCSMVGIAAIFALYASGSRSAWIATVLSLAVVIWFQLKSQRSRVIFSIIGIVLAAVSIGVFFVLKNNTNLQNAVLHTQSHTTAVTSSNSAHASAIRNGIKDVLHAPFGDGPGTAGPASVYNGDHPIRIAENYYVQIAQEAGWLGLALFLSILTIIAIELQAQIQQSRFALVLLASFIGLFFVNLLSHAWADDTLAFVWWGLAGIALAKPMKMKGKHEIQTN